MEQRDTNISNRVESIFDTHLFVGLWKLIFTNKCRHNGQLHVMQSLQHHARFTIYKNNVDYSDVKPYLDFGLPNVEVIERMRHQNTKDPNDGLKISAAVGCMTSLNFFKSIGATDVDSAMVAAATGGHIEMIKQCKDWGAKGFARAMTKAVDKGHIDILVLLKKWGTPCTWNICLIASYQGHYDIVKLLLEWNVHCVDFCMGYAAVQGHINIVRLCIENGATCYEGTILKAAACGRIEIIKMFKERGLIDTYLEDAMVEAARYGHVDIVALCKEYGAVRFDDALQAAIRSDDCKNACKIKLLQLFREWKVDVNLDKAIKNVLNDDEIKDFLIEWKSTLA